MAQSSIVVTSDTRDQRFEALQQINLTPTALRGQKRQKFRKKEDRPVLKISLKIIRFVAKLDAK